MGKFSWGTVVNRFDYDFDGKKMEVIKYHPWKSEGCYVRTGDPNMEQVLYHCEALHESCENLFNLVIAFIAKDSLGLNQQALVAGVAKSLECYT